MATHAAVPDQTRDSLHGCGAAEGRRCRQGVAGRLELAEAGGGGRGSDSPGSNLACIKYA